MAAGNASIKLLLVEDDIDVAAGLGDYLAGHGVSVDFAYTAAQALALAQSQRFDLFVLDINLPDRNGLMLCHALKTELGLAQPVIFLTARDRLPDKLRGFAVGAIDYVVKPFAPEELLARIRVITRHYPAASGAQLCVGEYALDLHHCVLQKHETGQPSLTLHASGFVILRRLLEAYPGTVARDALCAALWGDDVPPSEPLRANIHQLRKHCQDCFGRPLISTIRGVGYRFDPDRPE